jgi:competence protein ComEC
LVHLRALLREQWVVSLALAPLGVLFFGQISLVGLLANLVAIPWVTLVVTPLALLGMALPWCWDVAVWALQPLASMLNLLSTWRWASVSLAMPPWPLAALALLGAAGLLLRGPWSWRVWGVPLLLPALLWLPPRPAPGHFELLAADVGQGNAVLLRTARHSLLYDAGPRYSPESDAGHRVLVPLLSQFNEPLDVLMLSHRDTDHTGGAPAVLAMQPQVALWSSLEDTHPLAQSPGHQRCEVGRQWQWDGVRFEVLHPQPGAVSPRPNALSCVLRVQGAGASALLAGDIELPQERALLAQGLAPVDVLLVPHHGSRTSSSGDFLDALRPRLALVQAGYRNRFGHPAPDVLQRYQDRGIQVHTSVQCGAATWRSDAPERLRCERQAERRYWHHDPQP